jgi:hypothetical protein
LAAVATRALVNIYAAADPHSAAIKLARGECMVAHRSTS